MSASKKKSIPSDARLRVAVVGAGHLGQHHARNLASLDDVQLVAICDPDSARVKAMADQYGAAHVTRIEDLPSDLDAVSIAAPTPLHAMFAEHFLGRGVHCLVEKPMTATLEEGRALAELAAGEGLVLQVGHIERFNPAFDGFENGASGPLWLEARRYTAFTGRSTDTSVVFDLMIHDIDLALSLIPSTVTRIEARGGVVRGPLEDWASCRLNFQNGAVADIATSRVMIEPQRKLRAFYSDRVVEFDLGARKRSETRGRELEKVEHQGGSDEPLKRELVDFVRCVRGGKSPRVSQNEGLAAIEVAHEVLSQIRG